MEVNTTKSHFNLLQLILDRILKDISWMSILHQYHKTSGLKAWTAMCRSEDKWGNIFKMAGDRFVVHVFSAVWRGGFGCSERI